MLSQKEIERAARFMRSYGEPGGRRNSSVARPTAEVKAARNDGPNPQPGAEAARNQD